MRRRRKPVTPAEALRALGLPPDDAALADWCLAWVTRRQRALTPWAL